MEGPYGAATARCDGAAAEIRWKIIEIMSSNASDVKTASGKADTEKLLRGLGIYHTLYGIAVGTHTYRTISNWVFIHYRRT